MPAKDLRIVEAGPDAVEVSGRGRRHRRVREAALHQQRGRGHRKAVRHAGDAGSRWNT
jgi:hypothetical protein